MARLCLPLTAPFLVLLLVALAVGDDPVRKDALGDPLPDGAFMRLGTLRFRAVPRFTDRACLSPDGKRIAVREDDTIRLLDSADGSEVRRIPDQKPGTLMRAMFTPAGDVLAASFSDGSLRIWDAATGKDLGRIDTGLGAVGAYNFSADGKTLFAVPFNGVKKIYTYQVPGGKQIGEFQPVQANVYGIAASADGKTLASCGSQVNHPPYDPAAQRELAETVQIWDAATGKETRRLRTDCGMVYEVVFSPGGKFLALRTEQGAIQVWDPSSGKLSRTFQGRHVDGESLTFSSDGKAVFTFGEEGMVQGWEVESGRRLSLAVGPPGRVWGLAFPSDGKALALTQDGEAFLVWEIASGKVRGPQAGHTQDVRDVAFCADGKKLVSVDCDGTVIEWDAETGKELRRLPDLTLESESAGGVVLSGTANGVLMRPYRHSGGAGRHFRLSSDGRYLLMGGAAGGTYIDMWETATGKNVLTLHGPIGWTLGTAFPARFSPDGSVLAVAEGADEPSDEPCVRLWDPAAGRELSAFKGYKAQPTAVAVSPDRKSVCVTSPARFTAQLDGGPRDQRVLWQLREGKEPRVVPPPDDTDWDSPDSLAYSADGRVLATVCGEGLVVRDAATCRERWHAPIGERITAPLAISPDGRLVAVVSLRQPANHGVIRLYEAASGGVRRQFTCPYSAWSLAFSPDGKTLATGCLDTTILLWDAAAGGLELKKNLNAEETDAVWRDLASSSAGMAGQAIERLAAAPADGVPYLKKRVPPIETKVVDEAAISKLIAALDSDEFDAREKAHRDLSDLGAAPAPSLRKALDGKPSAEVKQRAEALLAKLAEPDLSPEALRLRRAVEVLERIGDPAARDLLEALSKGQPGADVTEDARAAVKRLDKRQ